MCQTRLTEAATSVRLLSQLSTVALHVVTSFLQMQVQVVVPRPVRWPLAPLAVVMVEGAGGLHPQVLQWALELVTAFLCVELLTELYRQPALGVNGHLALGVNGHLALGVNGHLALGVNGHLALGVNGHLALGVNGHLALGVNGHLELGVNGHLELGVNNHLLAEEVAQEVHRCRNLKPFLCF